MLIKCGNKECNNLFEAKGKRVYCSNKCASHIFYLNNKKIYTERARMWDLNNPIKRKVSSKKSLIKFRNNNPERFSELMKNQYKKNKIKWDSRTRTNFILNGSPKPDGFILPKKECKICKSIEKLEIHHEIYPTLKKDIFKAMSENKIYYLCRSCHLKVKNLNRQV